MILSDSPVAYWRLGETTGTTAVDLTGHGLHGAYQNSPTLGAPGAIFGNSDSAISVVTNQSARVSNHASLNPSTMSVEVWIKTSASNGMIIGKIAATVPNSQYSLKVNTGNVEFGINSGVALDWRTLLPREPSIIPLGTKMKSLSTTMLYHQHKSQTTITPG